MSNYIATHCPHGHPTPTDADRTRQGFCRTCKRLDDRRRRLRDRQAVELVRALDSMTPNELAERIEALG